MQFAFSARGTDIIKKKTLNRIKYIRVYGDRLHDIFLSKVDLNIFILCQNGLCRTASCGHAKALEATRVSRFVKPLSAAPNRGM